MRGLAQGATGGWVMLGLVFKWFSLCEFSLFDTPWGYLLLPRASSGKGNGTALQYSCLGNPMMEKLGKLQSMGLLRVGHD